MKGGVRKFIVVSATLILLLKCVSTVDYCEIEAQKCGREPHIGCQKRKSTFQVNPSCSNIKIIKLTNNAKNVIVNLHNDLRDKLAAGNVPKYPSASRMLEMYWDTELEATACLHVQYCTFAHDKCRATPSYKHPGQNLYTSRYWPFPQPNITKEWQKAIVDYFEEHAIVDASIIDKYIAHKEGEEMYGHFTVMSKDNNDRIGCCHITYENDSSHVKGRIEYSHLLTCNYRETNFLEGRTYVKGDAGTRCKDHGDNYEISGRYKHLCTTLKDTKLLLKQEKEVKETLKDFCEIGKMKCGRNKHVACDKDSGFSVNPSCKNIKIHTMTPENQDSLLKDVNFYRDLVASGVHKPFPKASKMLETTWDSDLETVACSHVKYCQFKHGNCLATNDFDVPGQSLYGLFSSAVNEDHSKILSRAVKSWFNQSYSATTSVIQENFEKIDTTNFGDFALMTKENQNMLGCCFITYEEQNWHKHLVTCLYPHVKYLHTKLYTSGKSTASRCTDYGDEYATSVSYPSLCTKKNAAGTANVSVFVVALVVVVSELNLIMRHQS